jgi:capsular exopolysaccharide synthesis family protein
MSRVDEALKRARLLKSRDGCNGSAADLHTLNTPVVAAWQYERFPSEADMPSAPEPRVPMPPRKTRPVATALRPVPKAEAPEPSVRELAPGMVPGFSGKIVGGPGGSVGREYYDHVAAALHHAQREPNTRLVMVTSAMPGEGKSLTAANLAMTLSLYGRRVLLIDADVHRPTLHELFHVSNAHGLLDGLAARADTPMPIVDIAANLSLLPSGSSSAEPMSLLISERMRQLLRDAAQAFDWVIVDTAPVCLVSDAHVLAGLVPAVVLVIRAGATAHDLVSSAVVTLGRERILGVVLNCVDERDVVGGHDRYGYGYGDPSHPG